MSDRIIPAQIRGARGMLGWSMMDLARASGLSISTVKRAEGGGPPQASAEAVRQLASALGAAGVRFIAHEGQSVGVVLKALS